jgi:hypothetical protein
LVARIATAYASYRSWLRHRLGMNRGRVTTELRGDDIWVGFKCSECGEVHGWHKAMPLPFARRETDGQGGSTHSVDRPLP